MGMGGGGTCKRIQIYIGRNNPVYNQNIAKTIQNKVMLETIIGGPYML